MYLEVELNVSLIHCVIAYILQLQLLLYFLNAVVIIITVQFTHQLSIFQNFTYAEKKKKKKKKKKINTVSIFLVLYTSLR